LISRDLRDKLIVKSWKFYCKHTHMQCASVYEENYAFLTFTDSATHFLWSTTRRRLRLRCEAKFLTWEFSDFTPCTHAQSNILHTK